MRHFYYLSLALALLSSAAYAQQPVLPAVPQPTAPVVPAPTSEAPQPMQDFVLGHRYEVKLQSGVGFTGVLRQLTAVELTFEAQGLGLLAVKRSNLLQIRDLDVPTPATVAQLGLRPGYYDIGSGSRYFFGPSGRNLREGEGVVQDVWLFLAGVNYGITNNISMGAYLSLVPGLGLQNQFLMLTPKVSFSVGNKWHLGAGALYLRIPDGDTGYGAGLVYGVATHGSADNNVSVGVGYGFAGGGIGSTPTIYLAGQTRVSRRVSLMSENYIIAADNPVLFGLYGVKFNWSRISIGVASGYVGYIDNSNHSNNYGLSTQDDSYFVFGYVYPVYADLSFRFGKPYQPVVGRL